MNRTEVKILPCKGILKEKKKFVRTPHAIQYEITIQKEPPSKEEEDKNRTAAKTNPSEKVRVIRPNSRKLSKNVIHS